MKALRIGDGRPLERLFEVGAVGRLGDAELLDGFAAGDEESAGAAFEAIVARHGPMVLRVCRAVLQDAHAAEDAFQATFLVLARRARALDRRERLGNWLYGVALRTSRKARLAASRRAARDRAAAGRRPEAIAGPSADDREDVERGEILHEEIGRLPGSYRAAVVACYLEGLTQAEAASRLGLAESTVRGRLARARKRLGDRLARRGVAPAVGLTPLEDVAAGLSRPILPTAARLPDAIVRSLARDALHFARSSGPAGRVAVSSTATALADGVLSTMFLPSFKLIAAAVTALAAAGIGLMAAAGGAPGRPDVEVALAPAPSPPGPAQKTDKESPREAPRVDAPAELAKRVPGIVRLVPVSRDGMVLSYMPDWNFGHVDNIGIGNPDGGNRTLIDWAEIPAEEANNPDRRFLLAIYSRRTDSSPPMGPIVACEVLEEWDEQTSWKTRPRCDPEPFATYKFEPGAGWKLFDVTPLVRARARAGRPAHGMMLRFLSEDASGLKGNVSNYHFVSREATGPWAGRRPLLLVTKDAKGEKSQVR